MIFDDFKKIAAINTNTSNRTYLLNLLKEKLQDYVLYFIYTHEQFQDLIFTGGTCLRKIYGLNRLSVDLDFDHRADSFSCEELAKEIVKWFTKTYQISNITATPRKGSVKIKMAGAADLFPGTGKEIIFVSVDVSPLSFKEFGTEKNLISTPEFSFFTENFDLPTMFANKICAFLGRKFFFGKTQTESFKARDVYDLYWLCQRSKQSQYMLFPNFERLFEELKVQDKKEIAERIAEKLEKIDDKQLFAQLEPFFPDVSFVRTFVTAYRESILNDLKFIFS